MRGSPVNRSQGKSTFCRPLPSWNGPVWWNCEGQQELTKSKALGTWVIDANGERVEPGFSQSIFIPTFFACALIPALLPSSILTNFATPSRFLARAAGLV